MVSKLIYKFKIPNDYKNTILIGYLSLIIFVIIIIFELVFNAVFETINGSWMGHFVLISLILGVICYFYFVIKTIKINFKNNPEVFVHVITILVAGLGLIYLIGTLFR